MASVFSHVGYGPVELLRDFSSRFIVLSSNAEFDAQLDKVWISHKNMKNLEIFTSSLTDDHFRIECKRTHSDPFIEVEFALTSNSQNQFCSQSILERMLKVLHCCLVEYVITQCLILYNWGNNSFELVFENEEFSGKILKNRFYCKRRNALKNGDEDFRKWRIILTSWGKKLEWSSESCNLLKWAKWKKQKYNKWRINRQKYYNYNELEKIYRLCNRPGQYDNGEELETFNKNVILYDMKRRIWSKNHALSAHTPEEFLNVIMKREIKDKSNYQMPIPTGSDWHGVKRILGLILKNHKTLTAYDGYGRLLKRHLKITGFSTGNFPNRRMKPIPSCSVSSYITLVLHKVVPLEFFGSSGLRKKFFREISKIVLGGKDENFTFKPLIQMLLDAKNNLIWIQEIQGNEITRRIISNILKWLLLDYIFLILKNHFYITEIGSSGSRLYYYRKSDMESGVSRWINQQVMEENLRIVEGDLDHWKSIERNWIETGKIILNRKDQQIMMDKGTEYISQVMKVRLLPKNKENFDLRIITNNRPRKIYIRERTRRKRELAKLFMTKYIKRILMYRKVKLLLKYLTDKYGSGITQRSNNQKLELAWSKAMNLKEIDGKLYYIKADVSDAFGSVLPGLLGAIIEKKLRVKSNQVLQMKTIKEFRSRSGVIEYTIRKSFSDKPLENSLLVSRSIFLGSKKLPSFRSAPLKRILEQIIQHQYLRINGKLYRLTRGLPQGSGGSISPLLCDLYYSEMDRIHFREFISCKDCILLRAVDDYLLFTSNLDKARKFYEIVINGIKEFNVAFNISKLKSNLEEDSPSSVNYLGLIFDVKNSSVRPDYSRYITKDFLSSMKLSDSNGDMFNRKSRFICSRSFSSASLKLLPVTLNGLYNTPSVVREILYSASVVQSNRILVLARHLTRGNDQNDLDLCVILSKSLRKTAAVATQLNGNVTKFEICWLFWKAAFFVFRRYSGSFPMLLTLIRRRINLLEMGSRKSGFDHLLHLMKKEMARGESWKDLRETLKAITEKQKPSKRFR